MEHVFVRFRMYMFQDATAQARGVQRCTKAGSYNEGLAVDTFTLNCYIVTFSQYLDIR